MSLALHYHKITLLLDLLRSHCVHAVIDVHDATQSLHIVEGSFRLGTRTSHAFPMHSISINFSTKVKW